MERRGESRWSAGLRVLVLTHDHIGGLGRYGAVLRRSEVSVTIAGPLAPLPGWCAFDGHVSALRAGAAAA